MKPLNEGLILGDGVSYLGKPSFELTDRKPDGPHQALAPGTHIRIDSIQDEVLVDGRNQIAYGSTELADGTVKDFASRWGFFTTLRRAPWEPSSVPERRDWMQNAQGSSH